MTKFEVKTFMLQTRNGKVPAEWDGDLVMETVGVFDTLDEARVFYETLESGRVDKHCSALYRHYGRVLDEIEVDDDGELVNFIDRWEEDCPEYFDQEKFFDDAYAAYVDWKDGIRRSEWESAKQDIMNKDLWAEWIDYLTYEVGEEEEEEE